MKRCIKFVILSMMLIVIFALSSWAEEQEGSFEPLSPKFLEWQASLSGDSSPFRRNKALPDDLPTGYIPSPVDLSHLADELPQEPQSPIPNNKASTLPAAYDLRSVNGKSYVSGLKSQIPYETCWAFASVGAMESNLLIQGYSALDLSEMHLAWFAFRNSDKSKAFHNINSSSFETVMAHGGNTFYTTALYSRLSGPVLESDLPYTGGQPSSGTPEGYTRVLRLRDVYYLTFGDELNINGSTTERDIIKQRIMETGAVVANYYHKSSGYTVTSTGGTSFYDTTKGTTNHAILIIGWDDNYSRTNFKTKPSIDGAWLIKNSWGSKWAAGGSNVGDNGCFWMSYANFLEEGSAHIVELADTDMKAYYYDALGWTGSFSWGGSSVYSANVFKSERDGEKLSEVGFYAPKNNLKYEIKIYTGLGTSMPSSPTSGTLALTQSGTITYAGYHTITLDSPVQLTNGNHFSVVVRYTNYGKVPVEKVVSGFSDNATTEDGSFLSSNGTSWTSGTSRGFNVCIKAFTVTGQSSGTAPTIMTDYPPDGALDTPYSAVLTASGAQPITWAITSYTASATLPDGLTLDSSTGIISGTPTKKGDFTFRVTATNSYGSDSKYFTMNIHDVPTLTTTSFTGYVGYAFSGTLAASSGTVSSWTLSGTLPKGLTLNTTTGAITGKPTKAGDYTVTVTGSGTAGTFTGSVKFTINAKPVKPSIGTASLANGLIGSAYTGAINFKGTEPVTLTIEGQPSGLTLDPSTGILTGTPAVTGTFNMTVSATNIYTDLNGGTPITKTVKLIIKGRVPIIDAPDSLADGVMGEEYPEVQFTLSDGTSPVTWTASSLPKGMTLSTSGLLSGTPTKAGKFSMTIKAANSAGKDSVKVPLVILMKPEITTKKLSDATTDKAYSAKLSAKGGTPITWSVSGLPETLTLTPNSTGTSATLSGTPTEAGSYTATITATNGAGTTTTELPLTVKGVAAKLTASLSKGTTGTEYTGSKISATGTKPITIAYSLTDSDKAKFGIEGLEDLGLTFSADSSAGTAEITGTPTKSIKSLPLYLTAENDFSTRPASKKVNLTIAGQKPAFTSPTDGTVNITCEVNSSVSVEFEVSGTPDITYTMSKASGFTLTQTGTHTAILTGTAPSRDGKTNITITAQNADGKATKKVVIQAKTAPTITTSSLKSGTTNKSYSSKVMATGTQKITWSIEGELPEGMSFNESSGTLKGRPTEDGTFTFTLIAENEIGTDTRELTLVVQDGNIGALPDDVETVSEPGTQTQPQEAEDPAPETQTLTAEARQETGAIGAQLEGEGYRIAAILPRLQAGASGMYDLEAAISEDVPAGAKMYWIANASEASDDDEIAEFYDTDGAEIDSVPENRKVSLSVWLNKGVIYEPVIAVKLEE